MTASRESANLDILRAFAVLSVVVSHVVPGVTPEIGRFGVNAFFVHTCLVLLLSLDRTYRRGGWIARFYARRAFRIYPLSITVLAAFLALRWPSTTLGASIRWPNILTNLLLVQNFTTDKGSIIGPMWSLPYEVQMYLLLPFVFLMLQRWPDAAARLWGLAAVIAALDPTKTQVALYLPCFMGGAIAYRKASQRFSWYAWPAAFGALCVVFCALQAAIASVATTWITCGALGWLIPQFQESPFAILNRAAQQMAKYSYGIYLVHWPLAWFCIDNRHGGFLAFAVLTAALSFALYHLVESPMIQLGKRLTQEKAGQFAPECALAR